MELWKYETMVAFWINIEFMTVKNIDQSHRPLHKKWSFLLKIFFSKDNGKLLCSSLNSKVKFIKPLNGGNLAKIGVKKKLCERCWTHIYKKKNQI